MIPRQPVIVKRLPENITMNHARELVREVKPALKDDRPFLVFDFSNVRQMDSAGLAMLLQCMEEAVKLGGDLKLASIPPATRVFLKLARVDCLFEIFENVSDAVESFYQFPVHAFQPGREESTSSAFPEDDEPGLPSSEGSERR